MMIQAKQAFYITELKIHSSILEFLIHLNNAKWKSSAQATQASGHLHHLALCYPSTNNNSQLRIPVEIPLNTGVPEGSITYKTISVLDSIPFAEFKALVCKRMGINTDMAILGYKVPKDARSGDWHDLSDESQLRFAIWCGQGLISHATKYTNHVKLQIHNMVGLHLELLYNGY